MFRINIYNELHMSNKNTQKNSNIMFIRTLQRRPKLTILDFLWM